MSTGTLASPAAWPDSLAPDLLRLIGVPTPYLITDLDTVAARYRAFTAAMPWVTACYAMKCNPSPEILRTLAAQGSSFEVASAIGMNSIGVIMPRSGWYQRTSASKPMTSLVARSTVGW